MLVVLAPKQGIYNSNFLHIDFGLAHSCMSVSNYQTIKFRCTKKDKNIVDTRFWQLNGITLRDQAKGQSKMTLPI